MISHLDLSREGYVAAMEGVLGERKSSEPEFDRYLRLMVTRVTPNQAEVFYPDRNRNKDMRVIANLPVIGQHTIWDTLPDYRREDFLRAVEQVFHQGKYDKSLKGLRASEGPIYDELHQLQEQTVFTGPDPFEADIHSVGISPFRALQAAHWGETVGVCRHYNAALVGLFLEFGIPSTQIRFMRGLRFEPGKKGRHIWVEVKLTADSAWIEFDATPKAERPHKSNREIYIYDQETITDYLKM